MKRILEKIYRQAKKDANLIVGVLCCLGGIGLAVLMYLGHIPIDKERVVIPSAAGVFNLVFYFGWHRKGRKNIWIWKE